MADSSISYESEQDILEEIDTPVKMEELVGNENGSECVKKTDVTSNTKETEDTFKKPTLFAAPSFTSKRGPVASSATRKPTQEANIDEEQPKAPALDTSETSADEYAAQPKASTPSTSENVNTTPGPEEDEQCGKDKTIIIISSGGDGAPAKTKLQDVKPPPRFLVKGPPPGKFKPHPPVPYSEPPWAGLSDIPYSLEILKNGTIVDTVPLTQQSYFVVGRLPVCDVSLEHPSISRYHAVIQYRGLAGDDEAVGEARGFYIHDLGSTHGTFVNKNKIPPKTYIRLRVGHVLKFGGSTRLFILQGPEFDEEAESELTVTELRERTRKQREELERRMMGEGSDEEDEEEGKEESGVKGTSSNDDSGCSWGIADEVAPEEDDNEENPFSTEFQEDQEAAYLKDPKKALQGFYDREGEELEFEYEDKSHGTWLCRIKLPVDDASGKQLVAEVTHTGKKKDAAIQCCLEACRILEARGLLRQEAVSRKRKKKNWEDEDFYDSDDDNFLDRTGAVEKKRQERMKRAGKIQQRPDTYESLVAKLSGVEKDLAETEKKLSVAGRDGSHSSSDDPLDVFMVAVRTEAALDAVERRKLHVHAADLRKEAQRLQRLVELTRPAQMPSLQTGSGSGSSEVDRPKKRSLPLFGAMKGGAKFKLRTGTIGKLPPKRANLPDELFNMKGEEEEEEEEEDDKRSEDVTVADMQAEEPQQSNDSTDSPEGFGTGSGLEHPPLSKSPRGQQLSQKNRDVEESDEALEDAPLGRLKPLPDTDFKEGHEEEMVAKPSPKKFLKKRIIGPTRPPATLSGQYPENDPDYCVWLPPTGQSGDGRTHLNDKYGY
ncbi:kanadaptin isoform X1 [Esox lucius]|uniref:FHA domain-containing protein n=2 Tax=Esox lucius TaxID=8010 RepID=A0A3P9A5F5_ESOLU|nr:kanadaptin isoform X1 [Esox lucius]